MDAAGVRARSGLEDSELDEVAAEKDGGAELPVHLASSLELTVIKNNVSW